MSLFATASRFGVAAIAAALFFTSQAHALDLDWHGQFRAEENVIYGYTNGVSSGAGYTVPNTGDSPATFQNLFFRLDPRVLVNDNVTIHSDIWLGLPDRSFFGSDGPASRSFYSTSTGNASLTAHTLYAEMATDFGTVRAGRLPLNWGLGLVWNTRDDGFDRLPSSGDGISLLTKFGSFEINPAVVKYQSQAIGLNTGGSTSNGVPYGQVDNSGVSDYTMSIKYKNDDEQIDLGVLFIRRIASNNSNVLDPFFVGQRVTNNTPTTPTTGFYVYNMWDFYARKQAGIFSLAAEVPLVSGSMSGRDYSTVAGAVRATADVNDHWSFKADLGSANGQDVGANGQTPGSFTAFAFHPDYRPGLLMFNYNFHNLANGNNGSVYDNPVTNARFLSLSGQYKTGKWAHGLLGLYSIADKKADGVAGNLYYNESSHQYIAEQGGSAQDGGLGFEVDYSLAYQWDEAVRFGLDLGLLFPGKFNDWNDTATPNDHKTVFGANANLLVKF